MGQQKVLTIDFEQWGSGKLLHHVTDKLCCLGFACRVVGATDDNMRDEEFPSDIGFDLAVFDTFGLDEEGCDEAAHYNDSFHDAVRIRSWTNARSDLAELRSIFRRAGTTLRILNLPDELR